MKYCAILASGRGNRMGETILPKQFMEMNGLPLIVYSIKTVVEAGIFDEIYIGVLKEYLELAQNIINRFFDNNRFIYVIGAEERMGTFENILNEIINRHDKVGKADICCMMDANRPLIPKNIYLDGVNGVRNTRMICLGRPVVDGICRVNAGYIEDIPEKKDLYVFQTPEFFILHEYINLVNSNKEKIKGKLGIAEIYLACGIQPYIMKSEDWSFKVTTPIDMKLLQAFLSNRK